MKEFIRDSYHETAQEAKRAARAIREDGYETLVLKEFKNERKYFSVWVRRAER